MKTDAVRWTAIGLLAVGFAAAWIARGARVNGVRDEVEFQRARQREVVRLKSENLQLATAQPSTEELQTLRSDHAAVERLRRELNELRTRTQASPRATDQTAAGSPPITKPGDWKNMGAASPAAALETALWAACGGDLDTLARSLTLEPAAQAKAMALLDGLPATSRSEYRSPERLVALLAAKDVPMGGIQMIAQARQGADQAMMRVRLYQTDGSAKSTSLVLRQAAGEWRLVVPESAIERYSAMLNGAPLGK